MRIVLLTRALETSAEVLPALMLLTHQVRTLPAEPTALLNAPECDVLLVDGRRDLPAVRGLTRLLQQTGVQAPLVLVTTEGGLDAAGQEKKLLPSIRKLQDAGIEVSLFIAAQPRQIEAAARLGAPDIELHTGTYCDARGATARKELAALCAGARLAHSLGLTVNAGHGINLNNAQGILDIPYLNTLNIGHSIICNAVFVGLNRAVREMLEAMKPYRGGKR